MKTKLSLLPLNGGAFNCLPAREIEIESERVLCNNVIFPGEFNPHNVRLWVIGNEFGALCAVWASHEQDAMDEAVDANLLDSLQIDSADYEAMTQDERDDCAHLGNASEPFDLTNAWMQIVRFDRSLDFDLFLEFAEARGACSDTLFR